MDPPVRSPVLVGRDRDLALARGLVDAAVDGRGAVLAVTGEAGIGKSRLLAEVAGAAGAAGCTVLTGRATPDGGAFRPLAEAVIRWLDEPAVVASAALRPFRAALERLRDGGARAPVRDGADEAVVLGEAVLRLLGTVAPAVLVLEDLHWADADTLAVVDYLAGAVGSSAVLLAVSCRAGPVAARIASVPGVRAAPLSRLDRAGVAALANACGRTPTEQDLDALAARSEGLPLLCEQLLVAPGDGEVPPTLRALVESRLGGLDETARAVVVTAAVLGQDPDWRLLGRACGLPDDVVARALRAAVGLALLDRAGARLRWPHALVREAVLDSVLPPERAGLAARVAEVLPDGAHAARLLAEAGHDDRAAAVFLRLARAEAGRGALRAALELLEQAAAGDDVLTERVAVLTLVGRSAEALALGESRVDAVRGAAHAELCLQLARAAVASGRWPVAESYVERAGRPDDPRSDVLLADAAFGAGRSDDAARLAGRAVDRAERVGAAAALCEALGVLARTTWCTDIAASTAAFRRAARVAAEHGLTPWRVTALAGAGMMEALDGDHPTLDRAQELARDAGMVGQLAASGVIVSDAVLMSDGPVAALEHASRAVEEADRLRLPAVASPARSQVALCRAAAGDRKAGLELAAALDWRPGGAVLAALVRGVVALVEHDLPMAHGELGRAVDVVLTARATPLLAPVGAWLLLSDVLDADDPRPRLAPFEAGLSLSNRAAIAYGDAVRAGRAGDAPAAAAASAEADRLVEHRPWWRRLLRTSVLECAVRDGWGDPVPVLQADLAAHEAAGATVQARVCRDLLRGAGAPVRRGGADRVPASLRAIGVTAREYDVLTLVATGLTNAEVARRLVVSPRTVDTHVANLLAKTGAVGRRELSRWFDDGEPR